jgi:hypothetical protein
MVLLGLLAVAVLNVLVGVGVCCVAMCAYETGAINKLQSFKQCYQETNMRLCSLKC